MNKDALSITASVDSTGTCVRLEDWDGWVLLTPDEADELAAELTSQADAIRAGDTENDYTTDLLRGV